MTFLPIDGKPATLSYQRRRALAAKIQYDAGRRSAEQTIRDGITRYDTLPANVPQQIVRKAKRGADEDDGMVTSPSPVEYHHVVFTLPSALAELAAAPKYLGAQVGLVSMLHTWGQALSLHPHMHVLASGGGLSCNHRGEVDAEPWRRGVSGR